MQSVKDTTLFKWLRLILTDPAYFSTLAFLIIVGDAILTQLIIRFVPYTEIDWETYMYHIDMFNAGERNYTAITGPTGALVYPAGHVHIHQFLHSATSTGLNVRLAQHIYGILYLASLTLSCTIYGRAGGIPNWVLILLPLSKRLHSIFVLRLFNDCWATVAMQAAIASYCQGWDSLGTLLFSLAVSVKMNVLLYMPGVLLILWKRNGCLGTARHVLRFVGVQAIVAFPFLSRYPGEYLSQAFDLSRIFLYKWTVNWRFINEEIFLSPEWAKGLLIGHVCVLMAFAAVKWCRQDKGLFGVISRGLVHPSEPPVTVTPSADYVATVLMTCNLIGIIFARSLHYQFYSWYAQQIPILLWRTNFPIALRLAMWVCIEYTWNIFPSTKISSALLVATNALLLAGIWFGWPEGKRKVHRLKKNKKRNY
ncbi:glycosyltransferase family 58 protein [Rickenella mellea]|uniref:Dol-P-Man:Man(5)GlcNAc(2)-PP-Dol alpha-1,3-mannosyltransferase n=1 Tax=Rickenella mellea TaxID=50990 RepID=A0A4Y7QIC3_9AGAM|nr:glycosyltransferase family 58 protein [Rickenella mellea]